MEQLHLFSQTYISGEQLFSRRKKEQKKRERSLYAEMLSFILREPSVAALNLEELRLNCICQPLLSSVCKFIQLVMKYF